MYTLFFVGQHASSQGALPWQTCPIAIGPDGIKLSSCQTASQLESLALFRLVALGEPHGPLPLVPAHVIHVVLGHPAQLLLCVRGVCPHSRAVAWPLVHHLCNRTRTDADYSESLSTIITAWQC